MSQITRYLSGSSNPVDKLTGNSGGVVNPDASNNINIVGSGNVTVTGTPLTNTLTITSSDIASISITGDSGGAQTGSAFTFTGSTTGLTFAGATDILTLGGTLAIANGGTNATSMTNTDGVVYYDGTRLVTTTVGTAAYVLTSNGAGMAPTFQAAGGTNSISITGDSGGALTNNAFIFTGGTTGLTFAGAGDTETLGGTLVIANGGTNATSMSTSTGIVKYDGTRLITSSTAKIDSSNRFTNSGQPAFQIYQNTSPANVTGDGSTYILAMNTVVFDQTSSFNTGNFSFVAPVTGRYYLQMAVTLTNIVLETSVQIYINTSQNLFFLNDVTGQGVQDASGQLQLNGSVFCAMSANDLATFVVVASGSTKTVGILGDSSHTFVSGFLVC